MSVCDELQLSVGNIKANSCTTGKHAEKQKLNA